MIQTIRFLLQTKFAPHIQNTLRANFLRLRFYYYYFFLSRGSWCCWAYVYLGRLLFTSSVLVLHLRAGMLAHSDATFIAFRSIRIILHRNIILFPLIVGK